MMKWSTMTQDWSMKLKVCVFYFFSPILRILAAFYHHSPNDINTLTLQNTIEGIK